MSLVAAHSVQAAHHHAPLSEARHRKADTLRRGSAAGRAAVERHRRSAQVAIEDARGREDEFTLDRNGFAARQGAEPVERLLSPEEVERVYYPEVERLLRDTLGASRV